MTTTKKPVASKGKVTSTKPANQRVRKVTSKTEVKPDLTKEKKADLDEQNIKDTVKKAVTSIREVKWKYPEDVTDQIERKTWRAKQRRTLNALELKVSKEKDEKSKEKLQKELTKFRKEVLLVP